MKIRSGFVSNSSSSSYLLIVPKETHEEVYPLLNPYCQETINYIIEGPLTILGQECYVLNWWSGNINTFEDWSPNVPCPEGYDEDYSGVYEALDDYQTRVKAYEGTWLHSSDA